VPYRDFASHQINIGPVKPSQFTATQARVNRDLVQAAQTMPSAPTQELPDGLNLPGRDGRIWHRWKVNLERWISRKQLITDRSRENHPQHREGTPYRHRAAASVGQLRDPSVDMGTSNVVAEPHLAQPTRADVLLDVPPITDQRRRLPQTMGPTPLNDFGSVIAYRFLLGSTYVPASSDARSFVSADCAARLLVNPCLRCWPR
jgi:hypothetical protein